MPSPSPDYDVISQPAMPPPPVRPVLGTPGETPGLAKSADPRHNPARGDQR
jgi:hypothetical protein